MTTTPGHRITERQVRPGLDAGSELAARADELLAAAATDGPVLVRGLGIGGPDDLRDALTALGLRTLSYVQGNSPRTELATEIFTATDFPPEFPISLHNELSYTTRWPRYLVFACVTPAASGGATTVAGGADVAAGVSPGLLTKCADLGFRYRQFLHGGHGFGLSWQTTFGGDDPAQVDRVLAAEPDAEVVWCDDGVEISRRRPGLAVHPRTGERVWFNQAEQWDPSSQPADVASAIRELLPPERWPHRVEWGDGSPVSADELAEIRAVYQAHTEGVPWRRGDLVVVDNMTSMHGRAPYVGERKVIVSLAEEAR
ncbi:TauD/TfdA family dioxygenase [Micromonospora sp. WMMD882]|uniref:TauD/TfdA family dioxygenase n=1 Tax=Micromonospora sp. WMMD882 TaxID=3015151 RepID=UPI00248D3600|nr:TauD/TfdA family dioxygenase [Micromonospora sp. WMMD882]WBB78072.1 TauD/TfdA family dioxygenase [Micromonospora sp. WMMD882]